MEKENGNVYISVGSNITVNNGNVNITSNVNIFTGSAIVVNNTTGTRAIKPPKQPSNRQVYTAGNSITNNYITSTEHREIDGCNIKINAVNSNFLKKVHCKGLTLTQKSIAKEDIIVTEDCIINNSECLKSLKEKKITLKNKAIVHGNVFAETIIIQNGSKILGTLYYVNEPKIDSSCHISAKAIIDNINNVLKIENAAKVVKVIHQNQNLAKDDECILF